MTKTTSPGTGSREAGETGTVRRVARLLGQLVDHPGESVATLAGRLQLPRSTTHRLLTLLRDEGFVENGIDGGYTAGTALLRLANRLAADLPFDRIARPVLEALSARFAETALLTLLDRRQLRMFYGAAAAPPDPMRYDIELNRPESLAWGATGRALLAWMTDDEVATVVARADRAPVTARALDVAELRAALRRIRREGYALTQGHRTASAVGIAVPFFGRDGQVLGDVALLIPAYRFAAAETATFVGALQEAAGEMAVRLGHGAGAATG